MDVEERSRMLVSSPRWSEIPEGTTSLAHGLSVVINDSQTAGCLKNLKKVHKRLWTLKSPRIMVSAISDEEKSFLISSLVEEFRPVSWIRRKYKEQLNLVID